MYKNVLLPIDLNNKDTWKKALNVAVDICKKNEAKLKIMTVLPTFGMSIVAQHFPKSYEKDVANKTLKKLQEFVKKNVDSEIKVQHVVAEGIVYKSILNVAKKTKIDLIIIAAIRRDLKDFLMGPNSEQVMRYAKCSVLVVR